MGNAALLCVCFTASKEIKPSRSIFCCSSHWADQGAAMKFVLTTQMMHQLCRWWVQLSQISKYTAHTTLQVDSIALVLQAFKDLSVNHICNLPKIPLMVRRPIWYLFCSPEVTVESGEWRSLLLPSAASHKRSRGETCPSLLQPI